MGRERILVGYCTRGDKESTELCAFIEQLELDSVCVEHNRDSLAVNYNRFIAQACSENYDILLLIHDDVALNCVDLVERSILAAKSFDVFGLAGTVGITLQSPALWHRMAKPSSMRGCVAHRINDSAYHYTSFGPVPSPALLVDGVFIGINLNKLREGIRFDETYPTKFHFYDLDFSLQCVHGGLNLGVVDIPIIHSSGGLKRITEEWTRGENYFLNKWNRPEFSIGP